MTKKKKKDLGTSGGVKITEELIEKWVAEAEAGYDLKKLRPRGRPPMGAEAAVVFQVRLEPELHFALMKCAEAAGVTPSEMARRILRSQLGSAS